MGWLDDNLTHDELDRFQRIIKTAIGYWDSWDQKNCDYDESEFSFSCCYTYVHKMKVGTLIFDFLKDKHFEIDVDQKKFRFIAKKIPEEETKEFYFYDQRPKDTPPELAFTVEFQEVNNEILCIDFRRLIGSAHDFY